MYQGDRNCLGTSKLVTCPGPDHLPGELFQACPEPYWAGPLAWEHMSTWTACVLLQPEAGREGPVVGPGLGLPDP